MKRKRKIIAGLLAGVLLFGTFGQSVAAEEVQNQAAGQSPQVVITEDDLQKLTQDELAAKAATMPVESNTYPNWPQAVNTHGEAAVVMDCDTGEVLYAKNPDAKYYPASITKIVTALVAFKYGDLENDKVKFTEDSLSFLEYGDAHIGMTVGEEISLKDALYGMMLASANEVAHAIGECIGAKIGTGYDGFIEEMNKTAQELGCTQTHFTNTNGLHDDNHYVSAKDMALIAKAAFEYEQFRQIINTKQYTIPPTNLVAEARTFQQNHKMIYSGSQYYYEPCMGGKTGFTDQSRTTLVTYAQKDGKTLLAVNLKTYGSANVYGDTKAMFEYGFNNFQKVSPTQEEMPKGIKNLVTTGLLLPSSIAWKDLDVEIQPVDLKTSREAVLQCSYQGRVLGTLKAELTDAYVLEHTQKAEPKEVDKDKGNMQVELWKIIAVAAVGIVVVLILLLLALRRRKRRRLARRRRQQQIRRRRQKQG